MLQLLIHLWGDYILQSDWMAQNKTKASWPCAVHVALYSVGFLLLLPSWKALAVIALTHFFIDRFRLARYVVWAKNWMGPWAQKWIAEISEFHTIPPNWTWESCRKTGYPPDQPDWLAVWLLIIADNILHLTINLAALRYL